MKVGTLTLAGAACLAAVSAAIAHHSPSAFAQATEVTVEGTIAELEWKNPHIYFLIRTTDAGGQTRSLRVEVGPISAVQTYGLTEATLAPGSHVILRANASRRGPDGTLRGLDVTTSDGVIHPLVLAGRNSAPPVAREAADGLAGRWAVAPAAAQSAFREMTAWPLTEAARTALEQVRAGVITSQAGCANFPPPILDDLPGLREIEVGESQIRIRYDNGGNEAVRTIHLDQSAHPTDIEPSPFGHSIGRRNGETLVVDSVAFTPSLRGITATGVPSGLGKRMTERFTLADGGLSLWREVVLEDPDYLTASVSYVTVWDHRPELEFSSASEPCDPEVASRFLEDL